MLHRKIHQSLRPYENLHLQFPAEMVSVVNLSVVDHLLTQMPQ